MTGRKILAVFLLIFSLTVASAQPGGGPGGGGDPGHGQPVPITGVEILVVLGGILGLRKYRKSEPREK